MTRSRLVIVVSALVLPFAGSAWAQTTASTSGSVLPPAEAGAAAPAPVRARAPIAALEERGSNPNGPFARLNVPQRDSIIEHTRQLLGVRYKWAGLNPAKGLDCSGMVKYVFAKLGIELPHRAAELAKLGDAVTKDTAVMRPGDLLVFGKGKRISHVGIYVGDGMMIQASSSSHRVVQTPVVKYRPPGGLQWRGVRRVIALDTALVEAEPQPPR
jgi:cell wall-associated NlpC family hydrolase